MINTTKLKQFLGHPDDRVRREVIKYFHNARINDNEVVQLSIQACKKYGWEECIYLVYENKHQIIDDASANELVCAFKESTSDIVKMHLAAIINRANLNYLENNLETLKTVFPDEALKLAHYRLYYRTWSAEKLWEEFKEFSHASKEAKYYSAIDRNKAQAILEVLGKFDWPDEKTICDNLKEALSADDNGWDQNWVFWALLVELAGIRKLNGSLEILNDFMSMDSDIFLENAQKALSRIGTDAVVDMLKTSFVNKNWDYRLFACGVFENIKTVYSEMAVLELLEKRNLYEHDIYAQLCFVLCDLFSNKAFKWGRTIVNDIEALEYDNIKERLLTLSKVFNVPLPEAGKWEKQLASDQRALTRFRRERFFPQGFPWPAGDNEDNNYDDLDDDDDFETDPDDIPIKNINSFNQHKTGRNDPCPCGSGKKYKKCCGNR